MTAPDIEAQADESEVDRVLTHRNNGNQYEFWTAWKGTKEKTWEPSSSFIHRYNSDWVRYCQDHGLRVDVLTGLSSEPTVE